MDNKKRMLEGRLYLPSDEILTKEREYAHNLLYKFNNSYKLDYYNIEELLNLKGKNYEIIPPIFFDYGYNIEIEDDFFSNTNLVILDEAKVKIGKNVLIGPNVSIYTACHPIDAQLRKQGYEYAKPVNIGENVRICGNVTINPGVSIGDNAIIASGSVVVKDVEENTMVAGNPARFVKYLDNKKDNEITQKLKGDL
ncbi:MAG: sugar O-acetyltransferase [Tissierellia bacterium]|nr:sugar O-acetyltransferase [Tissierellia bacterium]